MKNRTSHEETLADHESAESDIDVLDAAHSHFTELAASFDDWCDVSSEGERLWGVMFGETLDKFSAEGSIISGVAAAAYELAIEEVARKLEVSAFALKCGLEGQEEPGVAGFLAECRKYNQPEESRP